MHKTLKKVIKPFRVLIALCLVLLLSLSNADTALAARSGGRIGGGSFRAPSRTYSTPRTYAPGGRGGYYAPYGGGFGFPFLLPFWGIGGGFGSLFGILIFFAIANFLFQSFRRAASNGSDDIGYGANPEVSVTRLQVGLLAQARDLQKELDRIATTADTDTAEGRVQVLQETSLALLRHPEYCVYAGGGTEQVRLNSAEAEFNRLSLIERSKFSEETLSNVNNQLNISSQKDKLSAADETDNPTALIDRGPGEYIIVTLLAATLGKYPIPKINGSEDLNQALRQMGGIPSDRLLAIEVLWTPQAEGDTLTKDDLMAEYTDLRLV
ncbi:MAG: DUF1517 domain-containing protein [Cyanobacteria bacterium P01_A01_bin.45]